MKSMTISRHKFSGDLYKFIRKPIGDSSELQYYFSKKIYITPGLDANGKMTIRASEPLSIGFIIKDIKDTNDNLILSDMAWQISSVQPLLNAFGSIEGYTMKATKYQGTL